MSVTVKVTTDGIPTTFVGDHLTIDITSSTTPPPVVKPALVIVADSTNEQGGTIPRHLALRAVVRGGTAPYTYEWRATELPAGNYTVVGSSDTLTGMWEKVGQWSFRCTVTDAAGQSDTQAVVYTYSKGTPPPAGSGTWKVQGDLILDRSGAVLPYYTVGECYFGSETNPPRQQVTEMAKVTAHPRILFDVPEAGNPSFPGVSTTFLRSVLVERINAHDRVEVGLSGGKHPDYYALPKYRDVLLPLDPYIILHIGENLTMDENTWINDVRVGITTIRTAGYRCPIVVMGMNGGRNVGATLRRFPAFIDYDPEHNLIAGNQLYWGSDTHDNIDGNLSSFYQKLSGMSIRQAIDALHDAPYPALIGVTGNQDVGIVPFRGIIRHCQEIAQPWTWWAWSGAAAWEQLAWVGVTAGPPYGNGQWNPNLRDSSATTAPCMVADGLHAAMPRTPGMLAQAVT